MGHYFLMEKKEDEKIEFANPKIFFFYVFPRKISSWLRGGLGWDEASRVPPKTSL